MDNLPDSFLFYTVFVALLIVVFHQRNRELLKWGWIERMTKDTVGEVVHWALLKEELLEVDMVEGDEEEGD